MHRPTEHYLFIYLNFIELKGGKIYAGTFLSIAAKQTVIKVNVNVICYYLAMKKLSN